MIKISPYKSRFGFTIVELLVVIVVIGILAAITIVAFNGIQNRARASSASSALSGAAKKLALYQVDFPNTYPPDLATAGVNNSSDVSYQYVNYNTNPATYCITATNGTISYMITQATTPTAGGCAGHGVGGQSPVTNMAANPSFEAGTTQHALYNGTSISRVAVGDASSGSYIGRLIKSTAGNGLISMIYPIAWTSNTPVSVRLKVRLLSGSTSTNTINVGIQTYNSGTPAGVATGGTATIPSLLSTGTWSDVVLQGYTTPSATLNNIGVQISAGQAWAAGDGIEIDSEIVVQATSISSFFDGNSPNWIWNGTANSSTSTGPAS